MTDRHRSTRLGRGSQRFGLLLRELRLAKIITVRHRNGYRDRLVTGPISQNELAERADVDHALVSRLERGRQLPPSHAVTERIAEALELGPFARAHLLASAGYWPWPDLDPDPLAVMIGAALAIAEGDYRPLQTPTLAAQRTEAG